MKQLPSWHRYWWNCLSSWIFLEQVLFWSLLISFSFWIVCVFNLPYFSILLYIFYWILPVFLHYVLVVLLWVIYGYLAYHNLPCKYTIFSSVQSFSHVQLFATPWITAHQASLSITNSQSLPKLMSIELVMPSNHLILCCPLLLLPSIFCNIRVFSNETALHIRWPKYWSYYMYIYIYNIVIYYIYNIVCIIYYITLL